MGWRGQLGHGKGRYALGTALKSVRAGVEGRQFLLSFPFSPATLPGVWGEVYHPRKRAEGRSSEQAMIAPARRRVAALWPCPGIVDAADDRKLSEARRRALGCAPGDAAGASLNGSPGTPASRVLRPIPFAQHPLYSPVYLLDRGVVHLFQGGAPQDPHLLQVTLDDRPVGVVSG